MFALELGLCILNDLVFEGPNVAHEDTGVRKVVSNEGRPIGQQLTGGQNGQLLAPLDAEISNAAS